MKNGFLFVYILLCENGSYYTGYTTDLFRRYKEHRLGSKKCKFTRSFKPLRIEISWEIHADKKVAMKIERYIKKLDKPGKQALIALPDQLAKAFPDYLIKNVPDHHVFDKP